MRERCILRKGRQAEECKIKLGWFHIYSCGIAWLKCLLFGSIIGYRHGMKPHKSSGSLRAPYAGNSSVHLNYRPFTYCKLELNS